MVYTDDHRSYIGLPYEHESVNHSVGEYVREQAHTNGIESFWAALKRGYYGTYHRISPKHLERYVTEFAGRHNVREFDTIDQMAFLAKGMVGKKLPYKELSSLKSGRVDSDFFHHVTKKDFEEIKKKGKLVKNGDVFILASAHQSSYVGKNPCILELPDDHDEIVFVAELICIRANPDKVNPYYLLQLLDTETFYLLLNREKRGQSSHLYPRDLKSIKIPIPAPELQNSNADLYKTKYENYRFHIQEAQTILKDISLEFKKSFFGAPKETEE